MRREGKEGTVCPHGDHHMVGSRMRSVLEERKCLLPLATADKARISASSQINSRPFCASNATRPYVRINVRSEVGLNQLQALGMTRNRCWRTTLVRLSDSLLTFHYFMSITTSSLSPISMCFSLLFLLVKSASGQV